MCSNLNSLKTHNLTERHSDMLINIGTQCGPDLRIRKLGVRTWTQLCDMFVDTYISHLRPLDKLAEGIINKQSIETRAREMRWSDNFESLYNPEGQSRLYGGTR